MSGANARPSLPIVTLDGWSGSGKSTLARHLARSLGWTYLDSGAWYRALAWAVQRAGADPGNEEEVLGLLFRIRLNGSDDGSVRVDDHAPGAALRTPEIDLVVARVADHPRVRAALNERMRDLTRASEVRGLVADGRDAGTVIFPEARLKIFVEASLDERARRRAAQRGGADLERVRIAIAERDRSDAARGASAPRPAAAGRVLLNESFTVEEAVGRLLAWIRECFPGQAAPPGPTTSSDTT